MTVRKGCLGLEHPEYILGLVIIVFLFIGILLLRTYKGLVNERKDWKYTKTGVIAKKSVKSGRSNSDLRRPIVKYLVDGKAYEVTSDIGQNPKLRAGKKVGVYYHPDDPEKMVIDTYIQRGAPYQFLGIIFTGFALYLIYILNLVIKRGY